MSNRSIYIIEFNGLHKIGVSKNPTKRLKQFSLGKQAKIIHVYDSVIPFKLESMLHDIFKHKKISGEWFKDLNEEDIDYIKNFNEGVYSEL